jgi:hypothetical protein
MFFFFAISVTFLGVNTSWAGVSRLLSIGRNARMGLLLNRAVWHVVAGLRSIVWAFYVFCV